MCVSVLVTYRISTRHQKKKCPYCRKGSKGVFLSNTFNTFNTFKARAAHFGSRPLCYNTRSRQKEIQIVG